MDGTSPFVAAVKMCGGVDKIEDLQRRESHKIYDMVVKILEILENRFEINLACTCVDARGRGRGRRRKRGGGGGGGGLGACFLQTRRTQGVRGLRFVMPLWEGDISDTQRPADSSSSVVLYAPSKPPGSFFSDLAVASSFGVCAALR